jgi:hypothetical protein
MSSWAETFKTLDDVRKSIDIVRGSNSDYETDDPHLLKANGGRVLLHFDGSQFL